MAPTVPTEKPTTEDPLEVPENREKLALASELALHLAKGIKNIGIYRHNTERYGEILQRAHESASRYCSRWGSLPLKVESDCFSMFEKPVFSASERGENLPYRFYRDGIRHLVFRQGLTLAELVDFVLIALSDTERGDPDILSQLWERGFEHVEHVAVESLSFDDMSEEQAQIEVDTIFADLDGRLRSDASMRFARISPEGLEGTIESADLARGAVVCGAPASKGLIESVRIQLEEDISGRLFSKLLAAVFQVVEEGSTSEPEMLKGIFVQLLDAMLLQEDFTTANSVLVKLRALERDPNKAVLARELRTSFTAKMGEEQRLKRIGEILSTGKPKQAQDVSRYLHALDGQAVPALLDALDNAEIPENRQILLDALASLGKERPECFAQRLQGANPQRVRDALSLIDRCDFPEKMRYFGDALANPNLAVRLEALSILSRSKSDQSRRFIVTALDDADMQVRIQAARVLPNVSLTKAYEDLIGLIRSDAFEQRDLVEKTAVFHALGSTQQESALHLFAGMIAQKSLLRRGKIKADKMLAVAGLSAIPSIPSYKILQAVTEDRSNDGEIVAAAQKALARIKKQLFGEPPGVRTPENPDE